MFGYEQLLGDKFEEFMIHIFTTIIKSLSFDAFSKLVLDQAKEINRDLKDLKFTSNNMSM